MYYCEEEEDWAWGENHEVSKDMVGSLEDWFDTRFTVFDNYLMVSVNSRMCGRSINAFYSKDELKKLIDEFTVMYNTIEETDVHPKDCEDIKEHCEWFDWEAIDQEEGDKDE